MEISEQWLQLGSIRSGVKVSCKNCRHVRLPDDFQHLAYLLHSHTWIRTVVQVSTEHTQAWSIDFEHSLEKSRRLCRYGALLLRRQSRDLVIHRARYRKATEYCNSKL